MGGTPIVCGAKQKLNLMIAFVLNVIKHKIGRGLEKLKSKGAKTMNKINLKNIDKGTVSRLLILIVALVNAILQMCGYDTLPIENDKIESIISTVFLIGTTLWNTWKNCNITTISQEAQQIADAVRYGDLLLDDLRELVNKVKR